MSSGVFSFRITPEVMTLIDSWQGSLDGGTAHRKDTTYGGSLKSAIKK
jgi:hypothetical protein